MRKRKRTSGWPFAMAFLVAGLIPGGIGVSGMGDALMLTLNGTRITGGIDHFDCSRRSKSCRVAVSFIAPDGESRQINEGNARPSPDFICGSKIEVLVHEEKGHELVRLNRPVYL